MIAILDACTIFNLINLAGDSKYLKHLAHIYQSVEITEKVYIEVRINKQKAFHSSIHSDEVLKYLSRYISKFGPSEKSKNFTKKSVNRKEGKEDGELLSVCYALEQSREANNLEFAINLHQIHFITDDFPAKDDFVEFYNNNQIGKIIDTADLLVSLYLKGVLSFNILQKKMSTLRSLYNNDIHFTAQELKKAIHNCDKKNVSNGLSEILRVIDYLSTGYQNKIERIIQKREIKGFLRKNTKLRYFIDQLIQNKLDERIEYINNRIKAMNNLYEP